MDAYLPAVLAALAPFLVAFFTWLTRKGLDQRAAEDNTLETRLGQQRADFMAIVDPLREGNTRLTARVDDLERRLDASEADNRELVYDFRRTIDHMTDKYNDPGPRRGARVNELIGR